MKKSEIIEWVREAGLLFGKPLGFSECTLLNPSLLSRRMGSTVPGSVWMLAAPYYMPPEAGEERNLSLYAIVRDYHFFWKELFAALLPMLERAYPGAGFCGFADHSPIDERKAAAAAGLGVIGDNGLLITPEYGSFVFLGEVISTLEPEEWMTQKEKAAAKMPNGCLHCGKCLAVCPKEKLGDCLSHLTQQKGALSPETVAEMQKQPTVWGCDLCQSVCPMNEHVKPTKISFFQTDRLPFLTEKALAEMDETAFSARAYAWKGRQTILRNLRAVSGGKQEGEL